MIWKNWNKADKTLLAAGAIFLFALCLNIQYPQNTWAAGFLFCAEAALVGGIADWFAVTALFEKPLGFPWHTAILPRRREAFIAATGRMLQREFFGKKALISKIKRLNFVSMLRSWLMKEENSQKLAGYISAKIVTFLSSNSELWQRKLKKIAAGMVTDDNIKAVALYAVRTAQEYAAKEETKDRLENYLEKYMESKLHGPMAMMMAGMAKSANVINFAEAAELLQKNMLVLLEKIQDEKSVESQQFILSIEKMLKKNEKSFMIEQGIECVLQASLNEVRLGEYFDVEKNAQGEELQRSLRSLVRELVQKIGEMLTENPPLQKEVNALVYQFAARGVLQAQELLGSITNDVLGTMTDEQINRLVYDKAEPDLLWIRMNGSIVGAAIGLAVFVIVQLV